MARSRSRGRRRHRNPASRSHSPVARDPRARRKRRHPSKARDPSRSAAGERSSEERREGGRGEESCQTTSRRERRGGCGDSKWICATCAGPHRTKECPMGSGTGGMHPMNSMMMGMMAGAMGLPPLGLAPPNASGLHTLGMPAPLGLPPPMGMPPHHGMLPPSGGMPPAPHRHHHDGGGVGGGAGDDSRSPAAVKKKRRRRTSKSRQGSSSAEEVSPSGRGRESGASQQQQPHGGTGCSRRQQQEMQQTRLEEVERFLEENRINEEAAIKVRALSPGSQRRVIARPLTGDVQNPSKVMIARVRELQSQNERLKGNDAWSLWNGAMMGATPDAIAKYIEDNDLDESASRQLRSLPPHQQALALRWDLSSYRNPSAKFMSMANGLGTGSITPHVPFPGMIPMPPGMPGMPGMAMMPMPGLQPLGGMSVPMPGLLLPPPGVAAAAGTSGCRLPPGS